jgi:hypothetical protein
VDGLFGDLIDGSFRPDEIKEYQDLAFELASLTKKDHHYHEEKKWWNRMCSIKSRYPKAKDIVEGEKPPTQILQDLGTKAFCEAEARRAVAQENL